MFYLNMDKRATTLRANGTVAHPIHLALQNATEKFRLHLTNSGLILVALLLVETDRSESIQVGVLRDGQSYTPLSENILSTCR